MIEPASVVARLLTSSGMRPAAKVLISHQTLLRLQTLTAAEAVPADLAWYMSDSDPFRAAVITTMPEWVANLEEMIKHVGR